VKIHSKNKGETTLSKENVKTPESLKLEEIKKSFAYKF